MFEKIDPGFILYIHFMMLEWLKIIFRTHFQIQLFVPQHFEWIWDLYFNKFAVRSLNPYMCMGNLYQSHRVCICFGLMLPIGPGTHLGPLVQFDWDPRPIGPIGPGTLLDPLAQFGPGSYLGQLAQLGPGPAYLLLNRGQGLFYKVCMYKYTQMSIKHG